MFQQAKNLDTAFRSVRRFSLLFMGLCLLLTVLISFQSYRISSQAQQRIYILANGKAIEAFAADRKENIPVEARDHVKVFHQQFFTLDPDEKVIQSGIRRALYLADRTAKEQYDNLKENGYYANLIAGNISQDIEADSIQVSTDSYPFYFCYRGTQRIIRPTTVTKRSLVTEGYLRYVSRSDHNPHGFLIERWRTLENKDIDVKER
ncbi:MAG: conjugative transposon protein TraK [Chitinophagales bacterium]|nr:conjugative transposon protein TraK [Chitinophagales bacterium]